ncbi:hypothetical protein B296_00046434, partial [Ensete ventricosum]
MVTTANRQKAALITSLFVTREDVRWRSLSSTRAVPMVEEEDGDVRPSRDGAGVAMAEKGDGSIGAPQSVAVTVEEEDGNDDSKGGVGLWWTNEKRWGDGITGGSASEGCACRGLWCSDCYSCCSPLGVAESVGKPQEIVYPCIPKSDGEDEEGQASSSLAVSTRWISTAKL